MEPDAGLAVRVVHQRGGRVGESFFLQGAAIADEVENLGRGSETGHRVDFDVEVLVPRVGALEDQINRAILVYVDAPCLPGIGERVAIPPELIPPDASVEIEAKKAAGYYSPDGTPGDNALKATVGRDLEKF